MKFSRTKLVPKTRIFFQFFGKPLYYFLTGTILLGLVVIASLFQKTTLSFPIKRLRFNTITTTHRKTFFTVLPLSRLHYPFQLTPFLKFFLRTLKSLFSSFTRTLHYIFRSIWEVFSTKAFRFTFGIIFIFSVITTTSFVVYIYIFEDLPSPTDVSSHTPPLTTKIYDRHGKALYNIYKDENRTLIRLSDLPPHVIQATLAIEDATFFTHPGFSLKGIMRAFKTNVTQGKVHGGSTITQQLVKNTLLSSEKELRRKIREVLLAIAVDALYSKEEILEMYFNQIAYGGSTYGIEEAAQRYFGRHAKDLTIEQAALLAGIPAAPTTYSPFSADPTLSVQRQHEVLRRMAEEGFISPEQATEAMSTPLTFVDNKIDIQAPHFVMYVRSLLVERFGEQLVSQGGLEVYTTVDLSLQEQVQTIVTDEVEQIKNYRISNGAAVVTNPQTGEILAMVGSVNYFDLKNDGQVNITTRPRQPGSSIKPLTYALALENGFTPSTKILDAPITYKVVGSTPYSPKNYDGKYHGQVTLRDALANSYNIPAVKILSTVGVNNMIDKAEQMGITTWKDRSRFGLSLTLGGGEVLMVDMNKVYGTFATGGYTVDLNPLILVKDSTGKVLYQNPCIANANKCPKRQTLDPRVAYQMNDILSDNQARASAFGLQSVLHIPDQQVAVKTGTTNSMRDNWTIGYTTNRVVSVWVGNNDNTPMSYVASGITGASPIWNKIMRTQLSPTTAHTFTPPDSLIKVAVCAATGTLPCNQCPKITEEYFIPGTEPTQMCSDEFFKPKEELLL